MKLKDKMKANQAIQISRNKIYIYQTPNNLDTRGYVKIGQTERDSDGRIAAQTGTAMVRAEILAEFTAVDDNGQPFSDKEIHQFLRRRGIKNLKHESGKESEWFKISLDDISQVIYNRQHFIDDFEFLKDKPIEIQVYPSQQAALDKTFARWSALRLAGNDGVVSKKFLWNAKPRFGKTLTAYEFAKKINAKNVLVMTQRTSISNAWFSDYHDYIRNSSKYLFGSSKDNKIENDEVVHAQALSDVASAKAAHDPDKQLIYYTTLANIKGKKAGAFKEKNKWIYEAHWDLVILDETHEGTDTYNMDRVLDTLDHDFLLELSGTPFRKMNEAKGYNEKNTFSWSYNEEQEAKENWDYSKGENPYINLPKLNIYTFQVSAEIRVEGQNLSEYSFDFNEFFKVQRGNFVHEREIDDFLNILSSQTDRADDPQTQYYPFADNDTRDQLRHTFWKMPSTDAIQLLAEKLRQHPFFRQYQIIEAAGSRYGQNSMKAEKELKAAIGDDGFATKTITLSYDMLTTGTTVKEWTAVLMLDNSKSASKYIQTAFRAQTPWRTTLPSGESFVKTDAYVFDFNPDRVLKVVEEYANIDVGTGVELVGGSVQERQRRTQMLLNFLPVVAMSENGEMHYLDAEDAMDIVNYTNARAVVDEGFMSNNLFNVRALFNMHGGKFDTMRDIVDKIQPVSPLKKTDKKPGELPDENPSDTFEDTKKKTLSSSGLGKKKFGAIKEAIEGGCDGVQTIIGTVKRDADIDITFEDIKNFRELEKALADSEKKQKTEEDKFRDRLRGFARTIPVLLMAYGTHDMDLQNFDKYINEENFLQVTGISREDFRFLRSARDDDGQPIFVEATFNAAIREFLRRKEATAKYYTGENREDIYDYIPSQENNRVFTPKNVVNQMLDILEAENPGIFKSRHTKFVDIYMKSGNFLAEIAKRLYKYSRDKDIERIIEQQLFGITPHEIYTILAQETVYGWAGNKFKNRLRNRNFRPEPQIHEAVKQPDGLTNVIKEHFGDMKFDVVIGNPPYQEESGKTEQQTQGNTTWIYHYFQNQAEKIANKTVLIYPFGGWFDSPKALQRFGEKILSDGHTVSIDAYEGTSDRRAWYRTDKEPRPIFDGANLSAGVAIVVRDMQNVHDTYTYSNRVYSDNTKTVNMHEWELLSPSPDFLFANKLSGDKLARRIKRGIFGIESNFVENNPMKVSLSKNDWQDPIILYTNDKSGSAGRAKKYWADRSVIEKGKEFINKYKVVTTSAYPKKTFASGTPTVENVQRRLSDLIEILPGDSAFGGSKLALFMSSKKENCENFMKYTQTRFFAYLVLQEPNRRSSIGYVIPDQNFTSNSDIDWSCSVENIDKQLYAKYGLDKLEIKFIEEKVKEMK